MKMPFDQNSLVKDIVNIFPQSSDLFKQNRLDFCCGGNRPLAEAAGEQKLDVPAIMAELEELYRKHNGAAESMEVWTETDSAELIDHIKNKYHRELEEELKLLSPYVTKVAKVHGDRHEELLKVYELFYELKKELLEHTAKEEATVFPLLLQLDTADEEKRSEMIAEITELEKEHDHAGSILKQLREITADFNPPMDACGTYRLVYKRLEALESHTFMHVHLENNILFPRYIA
ncbi:iron-sulfur cluster repair di-iron protein [Mesobacillus selenatarsenatis]|uniref:Nitric oxide-dependent regulator DnrN or NorA n=1 Tax=Mesobacillus selenatarsenatis (strain DSM 18680 / JCM 14380 / FERM P-15431 / SF-1) TaxID=1321606 RepID=A0A0A8X8R9_MESS1|nr:iron-sulfur cluster repair di-iron protein [Mesobacillus selenatarsenatis]GAM15694.1 nitric oxide-dependent regulator DnrN or NorA [Mesobacillus selenatarsenatis SF-1]